MATRIGRHILLLGILLGLLPGGIWTANTSRHAQAGGMGTPAPTAAPPRPPALAPALRLAGPLGPGAATLLLTLRNAGAGPTTGPIALRVTLPSGVSYALPSGTVAASFRLAGGWACSAQPLRLVQCARGSSALLAPGAQTQVALPLRVTEIMHGATVQAAVATTGDSDPANAVASLPLWPDNVAQAAAGHGHAIAAAALDGPAPTATPAPARRLLDLLLALRHRSPGTVPPLPALIPPAAAAPGLGPGAPDALIALPRPMLVHAGADSATLAIQAGWNLITLPLQPTAPINASTVLAALLGSTHGTLAALYGLTGGAWSPSLLMHNGVATGQDFALAYGRGYLLYSDKPGSLTLGGAASGAGPTWALTAGWNLVGLPLGATGTVSATSTLRSMLAVTQGHLAALYGLSGGAWSPSVVLQGSASSGADFALRAGSGYLLYADAGTPAFAVPGFLPPDPTTVAPPIDPTVPTTVYTGTQFIYSGPDPIQTGVAPGTIELTRTAVLRGLVEDHTGAPLPGVTVTVLGHPEFGQTISRADGMYDLVVNGGGQLTLSYAKPGLIAAQRQVQVPWQDYIRAPDVALGPYDPRVSAVTAGGGGEQVAQGSMQRDADGSRQATLLFAPGTTATMTMPDGSVKPLPGSWHVRATEFTVGAMGPASMPGQLPATSGYTYAADYSIDEAVAAGATGVQFSSPVTVYVQNFIGFPVGGNVPTGYYDRARGQWVGMDAGRVVKILSITSGKAVLDVDGSGNPATTAQLQALGITDTELAKLAQVFASAVGQSFWRVPIAHFSPDDHNWSILAPPRPAPAPPGPNGPNGPKGPKGPCTGVGSIIGCQDQTLGEVIPIAGTPFSLHYTSDRVPGRAFNNTLRIPIVGDSVPQYLKRAELSITVAGRTFSQVWQTAQLSPHQQYTFIWDGRDAYGRMLQGPQQYTYDIAYVYPAIYEDPGQLPSDFGISSGTPVPTIDQGRAEVYVHSYGRGPIGVLAVPGAGLGGWSLNVHNIYDAEYHLLLQGDGITRGATLPSVVSGTYAATYFDPMGVADAPDGSTYFRWTSGVARQLPDGSMQSLAPASNLYSEHNAGIALGLDGSVYYTENTGSSAAPVYVVRRLAPDGTISIVAGGGNPPDGIGDNGPATQALLAAPRGLAVGPDGSLYIADELMQRVRRVSPDGTITTAAGTGTCSGGFCNPGGYGGDNGPAGKAQLDHPLGIAVDRDGSLYIADSYNNRVRRVGMDGIITTVAGMGECPGPGGTVGEGGPAILAHLCNPSTVAVGHNGTLYVAAGHGSQSGDVVYAIASDGILTRIAGGGSCLSCLGGPATSAVFGSVEGMAIAADGSLSIADKLASMLMRVAPAFPGLDVGATLISSVDGRQIFVFDATGRQLYTLDALTNGVLYSFHYDQSGRLSQVVDGSGNTTAIQHDALGNPTAIVAPGGQRTALSVDANGYLAGVTDPLGHTTRLTSVAGGLLTSLTTPSGAPHQFTYDADGRLTRDQGPGGTSTSLARVDGTDVYTVTVTTALGSATRYVVQQLSDGTSRQTRIDPGGARTVVTYGLDGSQTAAYPDGSTLVIQQGPDPRWGMAAPVSTNIILTTPGGKTTTITNSRAVTLKTPGDPLSLTSLTVTGARDGATTTTTYYPPGGTVAGGTISVSTPAGRSATSTLDGLGRVVSWQPDRGVSPITYSYDGQGRIVRAQEGSQFEAYTYDAANNLASRTDAAGQTWRYDHDADGHVTRITLPGGEAYVLGYDADGNQTSITMPGGAVHTLQYNALDQAAGYIPPGSANGFARAYDAERRLATVTLPDGRGSTRSYDAADRLSKLQYPEATITYSYAANDTTDPVGTLLRTPASIGSAQTLGYSHDGQVLTGSTFSGAAAGQFSYGYDAHLVLDAVTLHSGSDAVTIPVSHDADGLLTGLGSLALARNGPVGLQSGVADGSAMQVAETYDGLGELTSRTQTVQGQTVLADSYSYDAAGRISQVMEQAGGATHTYAYTYDADGQLTAVKKDGTTVEQYTYDANGNRTSRTLGGGARESATYDVRDRLQARGGTAYSFSAAGTLTGRGSDRFTYSEMGELLSATVGGKAVTYSYDGLGRRVSRTDASGTTQYLYGNPSDDLQVSAVRDPSGTLSVLYYDGDGHLVALDRGGSRYYVATDAVGTPRVVTAASGAVVKALTYDGYGDVLADSAPGFVLPLGYAGGLADPVTGLVHFGFRDYEPASGRWTAIDPALFGGEQGNLYAYVGNDPIDFRDPTGMFCVGGSVYDGIGVGVEICFNDKGISACGEAGVGFGESLEVNPFGGLATQGLSEVGEIQASAGIGTVAATWTVTPCIGSDGHVGQSNYQLDMKALAFGQGIKGTASQSGNDDPQVGADFSLNKYDFKGLGTVGMEGKLGGKFCEVALY